MTLELLGSSTNYAAASVIKNNTMFISPQFVVILSHFCIPILQKVCLPGTLFSHKIHNKIPSVRVGANTCATYTSLYHTHT